MLTLEAVSKTFGHDRALDDVALQIGRGEICGLVGHNGSGKSTLVRIIAGFHAADPGGFVEFDGRCYPLRRSSSPWRASVHFVHQDYPLAPTLNAAENIALCVPSGGRMAPIRARRERGLAHELLDELGASLPLNQPVSTLTVAERALVAVAHALAGLRRRGGILVLDEATASLSAPQRSRVNAAVRDAAAQGAGVLFVSHDVREIVRLAHRVVVLRDGRVVIDRPAAGLTESGLARLIAGRSPHADRPPPRSHGEGVLAAAGLRGSGLRDLSFSVTSGEALGIAGLPGSGVEEVGRILFGARRDWCGTITLGGRLYRPRSPGEAIAAGLALVPRDRLVEAAFPALTSRENVTLPSLRPLCGRFGAIGRARERREAQRWLRMTAVQPDDPERLFGELSGGNQQKAILARWLRVGPLALVLEDPMSGLDVGSRAWIATALRKLTRAGAAVLVCSTDPEQTTYCCERVIVLREGRAVCELEGSGLTADAVQHAAT